MFEKADNPNAVRGVTYHRKNNSAAPWVSSAVERGTLRRSCARIELDIKINCGGKPADTRFPMAIINPHANTATGAKATPTEAMPSVAKSEAL